MLKIILSVIIVATSGYIGLQINSEYNKKYLFFTDFGAFLQYLSVKIAFFQNKFVDCVKGFLEQKSRTNSFYKRLYELVRIQNIDANEIAKFIDINITDAEKLFISKTIEGIANSNFDSVEKYINGSITENQLNINKYNNLSNGKGKLIKKISVYIGIAICILLY